VEFDGNGHYTQSDLRESDRHGLLEVQQQALAAQQADA
jgi:hypothetical protein